METQNSRLVPINKNFFEYPTFILSEETAKTWDSAKNGFHEIHFNSNTKEGAYSCISEYRPATRIGKTIFYYLVWKSYVGRNINGKWAETIKVTRSEIAKICKLGNTKKDFDRIEEGMKRIAAIWYSFDRCFYDPDSQDKYLSKMLKIVKDITIIDDKKKTSQQVYEVSFDKEWLDVASTKKYRMNINIDAVIAMKHTLAIRVYEFLLKYKSVRAIKIRTKAFIGKVTFSPDEYPSIVCRETRKALERIEKTTGIKASLKEDKTVEGEHMLVFNIKKPIPEEKRERKTKLAQSAKADPVTKNLLPQQALQLLKILPSRWHNDPAALAFTLKILQRYSGSEDCSQMVAYFLREQSEKCKKPDSLIYYLEKCFDSGEVQRLWDMRNQSLASMPPEIEAENAWKEIMSCLRRRDYLGIPERLDPIAREAYEFLGGGKAARSWDERDLGRHFTQFKNRYVHLSLQAASADDNLSMAAQTR